MLTPADAAVAGRDPNIPALGLVLDPEALLDAIGATFPDGGVHAVEAGYVRYKYATSCIVGLRLHAGDGTLDAYVKAHASGEVAKAAKALQRPAVPNQLGPGVAILDPPTVVLRTFPNDPKLPGAKVVRGERIAYKPERRYVAKSVRRDGQSSLTKCYAAQDHAVALARATHLTGEGSLIIPRMVGGSTRRHTISFEWIDGSALDATDHRALARAGDALALLHRQSPPSPWVESGAGRALDQAVEAIKVVDPDLGELARGLRRSLTHDLLTTTSPRATIHGDLSADQILVCGDRTAIVDFDALRAGDPIEDLASFRATAWRDAVAAGEGIDTAERAFAALCVGYGKAVDDRRLAACTSAWLLRLGVEPFRRRDPRWPDRTAAILDAAAALA